MKEINIIVNAQFRNFMYYIKKNLSHKKVKIFSEVCLIQDEAILSIAVNEADFNLISHKLKVLIAEIILFIYKEKFIEENLNLENLNEVYKVALLKALVLFDSQSDKDYIKSKIDFSGDIYLDSLFQFKLKGLKLKWQEIVALTNENSENFLENDVFLELLRFLVTTLKPKTQQINVFFNGESFEYYDNKLKKIKDLEVAQGSDEISLITTLISLAPISINLHCISQLSNNTFKVLYYIFDKKVNLLV